MKNVLLIGPACTLITTNVKKLPQGDEELQIISSEQSVGGSGFDFAKVFDRLNFPYVLTAVSGVGVYGDFVRNTLDAQGIEFLQNTSEIHGCIYNMRDPQNNTAYMMVPGGEYDFHADALRQLNRDDFSMILLGGEMLLSDDAEEVIEILQEMEKPIIYVPLFCGGETEEYILDALYDLRPIIFCDEEGLSGLCGYEKLNLETATDRLMNRTNEMVLVVEKEEGLHAFNKDEHLFVQQNECGNTAIIAAAFGAARVAGVDLKNSLVFAGEYAAFEADRNAGSEEEWIKGRLAGMILQNR